MSIIESFSNSVLWDILIYCDLHHEIEDWLENFRLVQQLTFSATYSVVLKELVHPQL